MSIHVAGMELFEVEELAGLFNLKAKTIRGKIKAGQLQGQKLGKRWYVSADSIQAYFSKGQDNGTEPAPGV